MKKIISPLTSRIIITLTLMSALLLPAPLALAAPVGGSGGTNGAGAGANTGGTGSGGGTGIDVFKSCGGAAGSTASGSQICGAADQGEDSFSKLMTNIVNTLLLVLGMIAVIMIVIGGIRYTTSNGDAQQTKSAKDTIMYAIVGLAVAVMAYAIVNFVLARLGGN